MRWMILAIVGLQLEVEEKLGDTEQPSSHRHSGWAWPTNMPFGLQIVGRSRDDIGTLAAAAIEAQLAKDPMLAQPRLT